MEPITIRLLGAVWPSAPRAEAGMMVGATKAAPAAAERRTKLRRLSFPMDIDPFSILFRVVFPFQLNQRCIIKQNRMYAMILKSSAYGKKRASSIRSG
jgi:hypothetical protein